MVRCAIWYYLYNLTNVKNTHVGLLLLVKLRAEACNFTISNTPPCVFFTFLKLCKWHQIAQSIIFEDNSYFSYAAIRTPIYGRGESEAGSFHANCRIRIQILAWFVRRRSVSFICLKSYQVETLTSTNSLYS